jgi:hypothetical protein
VTVPGSWRREGVLVHLGPVDHVAIVWVEGVEVARRGGGFAPFKVDLGAYEGTGDGVARRYPQNVYAVSQPPPLDCGFQPASRRGSRRGEDGHDGGRPFSAMGLVR